MQRYRPHVRFYNAHCIEPICTFNLSMNTLIVCIDTKYTGISLMLHSNVMCVFSLSCVQFELQWWQRHFSQYMVCICYLFICGAGGAIFWLYICNPVIEIVLCPWTARERMDKYPCTAIVNGYVFLFGRRRRHFSTFSKCNLWLRLLVDLFVCL